MHDIANLQAPLRAQVIKDSNDPSFIHHVWFVKYHLEIVEKIAQELCEKYPQANKAKVSILAWLHDYEKIVEFNNEHNTDLTATKALMTKVGFPVEFIEDVVTQINRCNAKDDLVNAPIETQILSSSDAASHLVGPFFTLYWYENPSKPIHDLQAENRRKLNLDWEKKVTLPEIKQDFYTRYQSVLEIAGVLPERYLS
jgi:hypothetical protein